MSITDELREWASVEVPYKYGNQLYAIADRIDAEHERAMAAAALIAGVPITDENMAEHGWIRLPKDADGEYIHIGDELDVGFVARIVITDDEWPPYLYAYKETPHILTQHFCNEVSHYHEPTVEDVLREFAEKVIDSQIPNVHPTYEEAIAEFAAKLRLAEEGE